MKDTLYITAFIALFIGTSIYTGDGGAAHDAMHEHIDGNIKKSVRYIQQLPIIRLIDWQDDYQPRPTLQPLEVVPASATPYTPADLAEIYPSH